jgi:hypothetical protein
MIDTVRVSVPVEGLTCGHLLRRGWDVHSVTGLRGTDLWASCDFEGVRLHFGAGFSWMTAETSLPRLVKGDNALLLDWGDCQRGFDLVREAACDAAAVSLPEVTDWHLTRVDALWAWPVEPTPYIAALRFARLPRTQARAFGSNSVDWMTRGRRIRARFYDKEAEVGATVDLPSRLERQARPRREVVRVGGGDRLGDRVGDLAAASVKGLLCDCMAELGLDKPIRSVLALRGPLVEAHGRRRGSNLFRALLEARACGAWPGYWSRWTLAAYRRRLAEAGIRAFSLDGELPALAVPGSVCP